MAAQNLDQCFGVTNIKSHIPVILDLDDHNYDAWRELFLTHCLTFDVSCHIDGSSLPTGPDDINWQKRDGLVKLWQYGTLAPKLFRSTFQTGGTAKDIWLWTENQFRNNKDARTIQLDNELTNTKIGDLSVHEYCQKLKSISNLLSNLDSPVADRTLVMYLLNELNERFDNIINVIKHKDPLPTFDAAKSMLEMESLLHRSTKPSITHTENSSLATTLAVTATPLPSSCAQNHRAQRGRGRYGNRGRGRFNQRFNQQSSPQPFWPVVYAQWNPQHFLPWMQPMKQSNSRGLLGPRPPATQPVFSSPTSPADNTYQPTADYAQTFNTMSLVDPGASDWYLDIGATAHLASSGTGPSHSGSSDPQ